VFGTLVREVMLYLGVRPQRQAPSVWPGEVVTAGLRDGGTAAAVPPSAGGVVPAVAVAARAVPGSTVPAATAPGAVVPAAVKSSTASSGAAGVAAVAKGAAGPSGASPAGSRGAAVADDDDAAGEDVPELWHSQPAAPRPTPRAPASPPPGPAGYLLDAVL
jgi:hypothetical protein